MDPKGISRAMRTHHESRNFRHAPRKQKVMRTTCIGLLLWWHCICFSSISIGVSTSELRRVPRAPVQRLIMNRVRGPWDLAVMKKDWKKMLMERAMLSVGTSAARPKRTPLYRPQGPVLGSMMGRPTWMRVLIVSTGCMAVVATAAAVIEAMKLPRSPSCVRLVQTPVHQTSRLRGSAAQGHFDRSVLCRPPSIWAMLAVASTALRPLEPSAGVPRRLGGVSPNPRRWCKGPAVPGVRGCSSAFRSWLPCGLTGGGTKRFWTGVATRWLTEAPTTYTLKE
mmetsp:Transcript_26131/g.47097  ORF Transcript_26131/g.47097 Transcript_26131/m.47097 type:complete len:280 (+) Transcript_26131:357-1196(+)